MSRELHTFATEAEWLAARRQDVTSTEVAALFGLSPYTTEFELWHEKKTGEAVAFEETDRMKWGKRLQDSIALGIAEDLGLKVSPLANVYGRIPECRLGASFDFQIDGTRPGSPLGAELNGPGLLEIKKVDELVYKRDWLDEDGRNEEAPKHIEIQLQTQLEVRDLQWGVIGVLIGGNRVHTLFRARDVEMGGLISARVDRFWQSIAAGEPPQADLAKDAAFIAKLYNYAEPGKVLNAQGNAELLTLCEQYEEAQGRYKDADEDKKRAKSAVLMAIGDHERALLDGGYTVTAGVVGPADISYHREGYRAFRITKSKAKARLAA